MTEEEQAPLKKLKDYGSKRVIYGNRTRSPLTSVELVELYMAYLDDKNDKKKMNKDEFERFCCDFKKILPKGKCTKLKGDGYSRMREDLMGSFQKIRNRFDGRNEQLIKAKSIQVTKDSPCYKCDLKDDEVGLEDLAKVVCVEENYLAKDKEIRKYFTGSETVIPKVICDKIFSHYDANQNNWLSMTELMALLRDIFEIQRMKEEMLQNPVPAPKEVKELTEYADEMCIKYSTNYDGMLTYTELEKVLNSGNDE